MKSDSLIKIMACILSFSLILSTCVRTVSADTGSVIKANQAVGGFGVIVEQCKNIDEIVYIDSTGTTQYATAIIENTDSNVVDSSNEELQTPDVETEVTDVTVETEENNEEIQTEETQTEEVQEVIEDVIEQVSEYANTGISVADPYVNVRTETNTDSEIRGKLHKGSAATILEENGDWVKISSGNVEGYVKKEFLAIGFNAEELVSTYATKYATVNTRTLNVRESQDSTSRILTQIPEGETYVVSEELDEWVKISIDDGDIVGYISKEYVNIEVEFKTAISIEEEQAAIAAAAEAERKRLEEEEAARLAKKKKAEEEARKAAAVANSSSNSNSTTSSSNSSSSSSESSSETSTTSSGGASSVVSYAMQFLGNRYVYGGTSLTNGIDCSGFTQAVYRKFGYSLGRSSRDQYASAGTIVSVDSLQVGDLLFYTNSSGTVNHVAIYIGNGKIIHASNPSDGIKISKYNYRNPCRARRIIN